MDGNEMTIKELECLYAAGEWSAELQEQYLSDSRAGVQRLLRRWERETQERARGRKDARSWRASMKPAAVLWQAL